MDWLLGTILNFFVWLPKILTLGLLNPIIDWLIKVAVFWATDKFSTSLKIESVAMLWGSGLTLVLASYTVKYLLD